MTLGKLVLIGSLVIVMLIGLSAHSGQAFRITDNLYFTVANDTIRCIDIILPDDSGFLGLGEYEYMITCTSNWSDLTEQIVRTDENNTVRIPICFHGFGRADGDCSPPFKVGIESMSLGVDKQWNGGVCISSYMDVDIAGDSDDEPEDEEDVRQILSSNADLFDVGFSAGTMYADPGEDVTFSLMLESYASLTIDLGVVDSDLSVSPRGETIETTSANPYHTIHFETQAPNQEGEYGFEVEAKARGCDEGMCTRKANAKLVVGGEQPETGFTAYLFPRNINVKELEPVHYTLTIQNYGESDTFSTRIDMSPVTDTTFMWGDDIMVLGGSNYTNDFTVIPDKASAAYDIEITVSQGGVEKKVTAILSTNEMMTDVMRDAEHIKSLDPSLSSDVDAAVSDWRNNYDDSGYGEGLDEYSSLKDSLSELREEAEETGNQPAPNDNGGYVPGVTSGDYDDTDQGEQNSWLWIVGIVVVVIIVIVVIFMLFRKSETKEDEYGERYF